MKKVEKEAELRRLWHSLHEDQRKTGNDVLSFNATISRERPELFHGIRYDSYQYLKTVLRGLYVD